MVVAQGGIVGWCTPSAKLLQAFGALRTVAYEDGYLENPARFVQRIAAVRETPHPEAPARHKLPPLSS